MKMIKVSKILFRPSRGKRRATRSTCRELRASTNGCSLGRGFPSALARSPACKSKGARLFCNLSNGLCLDMRWGFSRPLARIQEFSFSKGILLNKHRSLLAPFRCCIDLLRSTAHPCKPKRTRFYNHKVKR